MTTINPCTYPVLISSRAATHLLAFVPAVTQFRITYSFPSSVFCPTSRYYRFRPQVRQTLPISCLPQRDSSTSDSQSPPQSSSSPTSPQTSPLCVSWPPPSYAAGPSHPHASFTTDHITLHRRANTLVRHKLALLLEDLVSRINAEIPAPLSPTIQSLLAEASALASALHPHPFTTPPGLDPFVLKSDAVSLRSSARTLLWYIRHNLDDLSPSPAIRASLEVARSACLHNHAVSTDLSRSSHHIAQLTVDIALLQELQAFRRMERALHQAVLSHCNHPFSHIRTSLRCVATAAASLGIDEYRVRGKTRVANAVIDLADNLRESKQLHPSIESFATQLHGALVNSLKNDLNAKRPAGKAMLLYPRIGDIPNFVRVDESLLRGGQPNCTGLQWLRDYGVTLVIDLRGSDRKNQWHCPSSYEMGYSSNLAPDTRISARGYETPSCNSGYSNPSFTESQDNSKQSMRIHNIPIEDFCTPTESQLDEFIQLVDSARGDGGAVFVHCKAGIGRTGTLIACWRIFHGASVDKALGMEELYSVDGGGLKQETFVRRYAESLL